MIYMFFVWWSTRDDFLVAKDEVTISGRPKSEVRVFRAAFEKLPQIQEENTGYAIEYLLTWTIDFTN